MNQALVFAGNEVRVQTDARGELWWVLVDVCRVLELTNPTKAILGLADDEVDLTEIQGSAGMREANLINESGLYRLIFRSNKPAAEQFRRWVFREVLPSVRQSGRYPMSPEGRLPGPIREHAEVSEHLIRVWTRLRDESDWLSSRDIARRAAVAPRTARAHLRYLLDLGLLDLLETFPGHLYRISPEAAKRHAAAYQRLELIAGVIAARQPRLPVL